MEMNQVEQLRLECRRLFRCETIQDCYELLDIYSECLFLSVMNHHNEQVPTFIERDARLVAQMILTKTLHLKGVVSGISYNAKNGGNLDKIIDPTIVACLIRNLYETVGLFNLIYRNTKSLDERKIIYNLWKHSGLQYRQRFESVISSIENKEKLESEKKQIEEIVKTIEENDLYKSLNEKNQNKIKTRLREKEYLMMFEGTEVKFLSWKDLTQVMGIRNGLMDKIYTYFSLYSHPSNVSVFQFGGMFEKASESFLQSTNFNLMNFFYLTSIFIADYIYLFPTVMDTFNKLGIRDQVVINFNNTLMRGNDFSINDSFSALA